MLLQEPHDLDHQMLTVYTCGHRGTSPSGSAGKVLFFLPTFALLGRNSLIFLWHTDPPNYLTLLLQALPVFQTAIPGINWGTWSLEEISALDHKNNARMKVVRGVPLRAILHDFYWVSARKPPRLPWLQSETYSASKAGYWFLVETR